MRIEEARNIKQHALRVVSARKKDRENSNNYSNFYAVYEPYAVMLRGEELGHLILTSDRPMGMRGIEIQSSIN